MDMPTTMWGKVCTESIVVTFVLLYNLTLSSAGMAGGRITVRPPQADLAHSAVMASFNMVGNTVLYGATGGQLFVRGKAGERFAVKSFVDSHKLSICLKVVRIGSQLRSSCGS